MDHVENGFRKPLFSEGGNYCIIYTTQKITLCEKFWKSETTRVHSSLVADIVADILPHFGSVFTHYELLSPFLKNN